MSNNILVLGGHGLASNYIERLLKAKNEDLVTFEKLYFTDPNPANPCVKKWGNDAVFLHGEYHEVILKILNGELLIEASDTLVIPDHTAPHVFLKLFLSLIEEKKNFDCTIAPFNETFNLPLFKKLDSGIVALSFANWVCPLECEEPDICPMIENKRTWNFETYLKEHLKDSENNTNHFFFCEQYALGVGGIPMATLLNEWKKLEGKLRDGFSFVVATYSKCHGIIGEARLKVRYTKNLA